MGPGYEGWGDGTFHVHRLRASWGYLAYKLGTVLDLHYPVSGDGAFTKFVNSADMNKGKGNVLLACIRKYVRIAKINS